MRHPFLQALQNAWARSRPDAEDPIRGELFSLERLEQHAETLAAAQRVTTRPSRGRPLSKRLRDNGRVLLTAYRAIGAAIREERPIAPAAEWLVDNFHLVEEQVREVRDDLPRGFYRLLPKLADGPLAGYPRVFGIAWAFVAHTDSHFHPDALSRFVRAYQRVEPLTIGELWAVAITLRILLVENLRRSAQWILNSRAESEAADHAADRLLGMAQGPAEPVAAVLWPFEANRLSRSFAVQLIQRLRDQDPAVTPALRWLDDRLASQGTTADEIVREEHQLQGAANVTVRNVIMSMRLMSDINWEDFFESVSLVDEALCAESDFAAMEFSTRDRYRHAIEALARGSGVSEIEVTRRAIEAARCAGSQSPAAADATSRRVRDPGYHLISGGRPELERVLGFHPSIRGWFVRAAAAGGILGYLGSIALLTTILLSVALRGRGSGDSGSRTARACIARPGSGIRCGSRTREPDHHRSVAPKTLPGLELREGVPPSLRTLVVVPTLLTTRAEVEEQIERLEVHYLTGSEGDVRFALLSDWTDATAETVLGDDALLTAARDGIGHLNLRHDAAPDGERFLLLHRRRVWNHGEGKWMGWSKSAASFTTQPVAPRRHRHDVRQRW